MLAHGGVVLVARNRQRRVARGVTSLGVRALRKQEIGYLSPVEQRG